MEIIKCISVLFYLRLITSQEGYIFNGYLTFIVQIHQRFDVKTYLVVFLLLLLYFQAHNTLKTKISNKWLSHLPILGLKIVKTVQHFVMMTIYGQGVLVI